MLREDLPEAPRTLAMLTFIKTWLQIGLLLAVVLAVVVAALYFGGAFLPFNG